MATQTQVNNFIKQIAPIIVKYAKMFGYKYPSAIIAQACLESGYGTSSLGCKYHNYFGMKCGSYWKGKSVNLETSEEYEVGTYTNIKANFRVYDSMEAGVKGYFDFISTTRYANLKNANSSKNYIELIKIDGYATSSKYVDNVYAVVTTRDLLVYDEEKLPVSTTPKKTVEEIAKEIIDGKWGNGTTRKQKLTEAGYSYTEIQSMVNNLLKKTDVSKYMKTNKEIAIEVYKGKWGNGAERKKKLTEAGYDYKAVQSIVNDIVKGKVKI